jgi:dolichol kinase
VAAGEGTEAPHGPPPRPSLRDRIIRRGLKLAGLAVLVYYDLPKKIFGVPVYWAFVLGAAVIVLIEIARLTRAVRLPAVRPYEEWRPAGYVYWGAGLAALVAFFPEGVAITALVVSAVVDTLAGELRGGRIPPARVRAITLVAFGALSGLLLAFFLPQEPLTFLGAAAILGGVLAAGVEGRHWSALDDDLLLPLLPALAWLGCSLVIPGAVALGFHLPWLARG